jgi:error-prone DNA polymerase
MIGIDTAKSVFHIHGVDETGTTVIRRKLQRSELLNFFEQQASCLVVLEACSAGPHWARVFGGMGHDVKLIAPDAVKPFVKKGRKNDAADAAAICTAAMQPNTKFVPVKNVAQQGILALHSARGLLVKQQIMLGNALRGLLAEFGLVVPKGARHLDELMAMMETDNTIPDEARQAVTLLFGQLQAGRERIKTLEAEIVSHARHDATARRLATIPGLGPMTASLMAATIGDFSVFASARHFAAWLGLVPRQHSTGGKASLGRITRTGNKEIRRLLIIGATSMLFRASYWKSAMGAWVRKLLQRRPARLASVALANKMARIAWALMTRDDVYRADGGRLRVKHVIA